jgi:hypothetical protein
VSLSCVLGRGSSIDETHGDDVTKDDETVVDSEQGSSTSSRRQPMYQDEEKSTSLTMATSNSAHAYHLTTATRRGPKPSNPTNIHPGAALNAGTDNKVCGTREHALSHWSRMLTGHSFMAHPETLLPLTNIEDPIERFVAVVKFYLSGWHIKPPYAP